MKMASTLGMEGIEAIVLRTIDPEPTLWEAILPEQCLGLPASLAAVDRLLDDPAFFAPYRTHFHATIGRPSIPIETYLRMMLLKHRYRLSYETLCAEVADSLSWRRFCRIPLGRATPHPTTLMKITSRCGQATIEKLNETLLAKAHAARVVKLDKARADTTVVPANVSYPTDSGLLAKAVGRLSRLVERIHAAGGATRTRMRDRRRAAGRRARAIASRLRLRNDDAKAAVLAITGQLAGLAETTATDAERIVVNARRGLRRADGKASKKLAGLVTELETTIARTRQIAAQTRSRLAGDMPDGATRLVSLHDPDARPIAKGRLGRPVELGYKAQVVDNADGIVLDHSVMIGNPPDAPQLVPAITRIARRFGKAPRAVTADRGYGQAKVDADLEALGSPRWRSPARASPPRPAALSSRPAAFVG